MSIGRCKSLFGAPCCWPKSVTPIPVSTHATKRPSSWQSWSRTWLPRTTWTWDCHAYELRTLHIGKIMEKIVLTGTVGSMSREDGGCPLIADIDDLKAAP